MNSFGYYIHQVKTLPPREVIRRGFAVFQGALRVPLRRAKARLFGTEISDAVFIRDAWGHPCPFGTGQDIIRHFRRRASIPFLPGLSDPIETRSLVANNMPDSVPALIARADKICGHVFNLLGSGDVVLGEHIDWHVDFKTGYRWREGIYYEDVEIPYGKGDIKVPWELSRFSHAVTLGQAYWLTGDEKYAHEFAAQVSAWIESNRPQFGVNWKCTMDVAIRVCNWIAGYVFFRHSQYLSDAFLLTFLKSLYQHGRHIRENLEYSETGTSNHYLSNIVGLVYLGILFPEFKEAAEWREFGISQLRHEMQKQVRFDGCDYEASTCYHRLVLELFLFPTILAVINDPGFRGGNYQEITSRIFGAEYAGRLHAMFEAVSGLLKPNGTTPQIGDNDNGRLHAFAQRDTLDLRYLLDFGAVFFNEAGLKVAEFGFSEDGLWVFGRNGVASWKKLKDNGAVLTQSRAFPETGWYVMRTARIYCLITCGPNGLRGNGSHTHNDKLSFELALDGIDIIVDPGTYVYTPDPGARNLFRSTAYHNTVSVNELEQNQFDRGCHGLFHINNEARPEAVWTSNAARDECRGLHFGFDRSAFHHRRAFQLEKKDGVIIITDTVSGHAPRSTAFFHLKPGTAIERIAGDEFRIGNVRAAFSGAAGIRIKEAWYSREYGTRQKSACLEVRFQDYLETRLVCR